MGFCFRSLQKSSPSFKLSGVLATDRKYRGDLKANSNTRDDLLNDTPTSSPSPQAEMSMSWVGHFSLVTQSDSTYGYFSQKWLISCYTT